MSTPRVLILHGWQGSGPDHWQTWLAARLRDRGLHVQYPDLPECDVPCPDRWGAALTRELHALTRAPGDGERVVVAHSLGCVLWLREAAEVRPAQRVDRVLLVAPPCRAAQVPELERFFPSGAHAEAVAHAATSTRLVCSDADPYCPAEQADVRYAQPLGIPAEVLGGAGHLNTDAGFGPWPDVEAWVLRGGDGPLVGAAQDGAKNGALM